MNSWTIGGAEQHRMTLFAQVSAHYSADPYNMLDQLKKMNLKHVKVILR